MTRTLQTSTDVGGSGTAIQKPGTYHCTITHAADGSSTRGKVMNGCSAVMSVLAGTEAGQVEKEFHLHLYDPDLSKSETGQEWSAKKQTAYGIAVNQIDPSKLGDSLDVDFADLAGQQLIITLEESEYEGKKRIDLAYANIYHVDDPRAKDFPKNKDALDLLPKEFRKPADFFKPLSGGKKPAKEQRMTQSQLDDL